MTELCFGCVDELVALVDEARGDVSREVWLRRAVVAMVGLSGVGGVEWERALLEVERGFFERFGRWPWEDWAPWAPLPGGRGSSVVRKASMRP